MSHYIGNVNIIKFKDVVYHFFLAVLNYALFLTDVNHHTDFLFCDGFLISVGVKTEHTDYKVCGSRKKLYKRLCYLTEAEKYRSDCKGDFFRLLHSELFGCKLAENE